MGYTNCQDEKNSIYACSIVLRVSIYASNKPPCGTLAVKIKKPFNLGMLSSYVAFYLRIK